MALDYCILRETNSTQHLVPQKSVSLFNIRYRKQTGQNQVLKSLILVQLNEDQNKWDIQEIQFAVLYLLQTLRKWKENKAL